MIDSHLWSQVVHLGTREKCCAQRERERWGKVIVLLQEVDLLELLEEEEEVEAEAEVDVVSLFS